MLSLLQLLPQLSPQLLEAVVQAGAQGTWRVTVRGTSLQQVTHSS